MLAALKKVEALVLETTRHVKQYCSNIFCFAIASGYCASDPTAPEKPLYAGARLLAAPGLVPRAAAPDQQFGGGYRD